MMRAEGAKDGPAMRPTYEFESNLEYAGLVYGKAPLLFDAWRKSMGDEAWVGTLRAYVDQQRYRWVNANTLLELAQKRSSDPKGLAALRKRWWLEAHGDEDIGRMQGLDLQGLGAATGAVDLDPAALKQYEEALKALMGDSSP